MALDTVVGIPHKSRTSHTQAVTTTATTTTATTMAAAETADAVVAATTAASAAVVAAVVAAEVAAVVATAAAASSAIIIVHISPVTSAPESEPAVAVATRRHFCASRSGRVRSSGPPICILPSSRLWRASSTDSAWPRQRPAPSTGRWARRTCRATSTACLSMRPAPAWVHCAVAPRSCADSVRTIPRALAS